MALRLFMGLQNVVENSDHTPVGGRWRLGRRWLEGEGVIMTRPAHGIRAIDLDRSPGPDDWLTIAVGTERLLPVRTDVTPRGDRLGMVVFLDPPPSDDALFLLTRLLVDGTFSSINRQWVDSPSRRWAAQAAARVITSWNAAGDGLLVESLH
jgi:hypothetical protein